MYAFILQSNKEYNRINNRWFSLTNHLRGSSYLQIY
jgi:hypothetical protein